MNITAVAVRQDKAKFFCRVLKPYSENCVITFLTSRYNTYRWLKKTTYNVFMIQDYIQKNTDISKLIARKSESIEFEKQTKLIKPDRLENQFQWLSNAYTNYFDGNNVDKLLIWNGSELQGMIASTVAAQHNISTRFFEIGNFPNKIFLDPQGVNAKSSLCQKDLAVCNNYKSQKINSFINDLKTKKEVIHLVNQAKSKTKINFAEIWDYIYNAFTKYPIYEKELNLFVKIYKYLNNKKLAIPDDNPDYLNDEFILFPLQVSTDTQVVVNSDVDVFQAIDYCLEQSKQLRFKLYIKIHPAEKNKKVIGYIQNLKKDNRNLYITKQNIYLLIKHSKKVITINSTVGIEALIYHKHLELLGRALYKKYSQPDLNIPVDIEVTNRFLYNYFFNCLVDGDFFNDQPLNISLD